MARKKDLIQFFISANSAQERRDFDLERYTDAYILRNPENELEVCTGCGTLSTDEIKAPHLACCPDSSYVPLRKYLKNSRYKQF